MKLLGCFKIVPNLEQLTESQWKLDDQQRIDTRFVRREWDCYSESLLELMLRARDKSNFINSLEALTVSNEEQTTFLKNIYGLRFHKVIRMEESDSECTMFMPEKTAGRISQYCQARHPDCVLFGAQSSDEGNIKVPYLVAEQMRWPCISDVVEFEAVFENSISVSHIQFGKTMHRHIKLPCILVVGNAPDTYLRIPTLRDKLATAGETVEEWKNEESNRNEGVLGNSRLVHLERKNQGRNALHLKEEQIEKLVVRLYQEHIDKRVNDN